MKHKVGDKVRFLNEVGGGIISKITGSDMVYVMDEDGFEIPVSATEIVVVGQEEYKKTTSDISLKDELSAQNDVIEQARQPSPVMPDMD